MIRELRDIQAGMIQLTGLKPKGKWYLLYGPALANLGSVGKGILFIDFAHKENKDLPSIKNWFPHELNHQIYDHTNFDTINNVLNRCLNEGFAVFVNKKYWNEILGDTAYSLAMSLSYSESELSLALDNWQIIMDSFKTHYLSENKDLIDLFGARNEKLKEVFPGAIGYLIGYKIVERYVEIYGENSWKDVYHLSSTDVLEKSEFFSK